MSPFNLHALTHSHARALAHAHARAGLVGRDWDVTILTFFSAETDPLKPSIHQAMITKVQSLSLYSACFNVRDWKGEFFLVNLAKKLLSFSVLPQHQPHSLSLGQEPLFSLLFGTFHWTLIIVELVFVRFLGLLIPDGPALESVTQDGAPRRRSRASAVCSKVYLRE